MDFSKGLSLNYVMLIFGYIDLPSHPTSDHVRLSYPPQSLTSIMTDP